VAGPNSRWWEARRNLGFLGTVIAGVVVGIILLAVGLVPVGRWIVAAWEWMVRPVAVPFVVLAGLAAFLAVAVARFLLSVREAPPPAWLNYRQDEFL
jgi:hypothetical protein